MNVLASNAITDGATLGDRVIDAVGLLKNAPAQRAGAAG